MNKIVLVIAIVTVVMALIPYTLAMITLHKKKQVTRIMFRFQALGLLLDCLATIAMFNIRKGFSWSTHAYFSLAALLFMGIEFLLISKFYGKKVPKGLMIFSKMAYVYWLFIFFFGSMVLK